MSEDDYFPDQKEDYYSTGTHYIFNNEMEVNDHINKIINDDLAMYPISDNNIPLNYNQTNINDNIYNNPQKNSVLTLRLQQEPKFQPMETNMQYNPNNNNSAKVFHLSKVNKEQNINKVPFNYRKYFSDDFDPNIWKQFYHETDQFFNYEYDDNNLREVKLISRNRENPDIIETYEGQVNENNEKHGLGKLETSEKTLMGHWRNNQFTGWGREINRNGEIYEGKFVNGNLFGKGMHKNSKEYFIGEFQNKKMFGYGEIFTDEYHYYGQLWNNLPHGNGKIHIYKEGTYEGYFENGEIEGNGVFKWNNGNYYFGEMKRGKMNGKGKLVHRNGFVENGYFKDGYFVKEL